jgi:hypothetical protein
MRRQDVTRIKTKFCEICLLAFHKHCTYGRHRNSCKTLKRIAAATCSRAEKLESSRRPMSLPFPRGRGAAMGARREGRLSSKRDHEFGTEKARGPESNP